MSIRLLSIIFLIVHCNGKDVVFNRDTTLFIEYNWHRLNTPCSNILIYPVRLNNEFDLPQDIYLQKIILPVDGLIMLRPGVTTFLSDTSKCDKEEVHIMSDDIQPWMSSRSWKSIDKNLKYNEATPHYDRVPCINDTVYLSKVETFGIRMPAIRQSVRSIVLDNVKLSPLEWEGIYFSSPKKFINEDGADLPSVTIHPYTDDCTFFGTCFCHNDNLPKELCEYEITGCPPIRCLYPVRPINHCCDICGAVLKMRIGDSSSVKRFHNEVQELIQNQNSEQIDWYIGAAVNNNIPYLQAIFVDIDSPYDGRSTKLGKFVFDSLNGDLQERIIFSISGLPWAGPDAAKGGWEIFIMFAVVLLFFIGLIIYYYPPRSLANVNPFRPFDFVQFDNRSREGSLMLGISHLSLDKAFDNPMYDKERKSLKRDQQEEHIEQETDEEYSESHGEETFEDNSFDDSNKDK